ncbi:hypothetical protein [Gimesia aquarii]|uniref:Uncharacterized protein n=1 Tax=Gimesia aquarii TaxID=2527964 RepID=A0A517X294_9PLAN|nr:hypothetical protein [Gimesia aquarii]QDU11625.1 hypothetical protein V202x_50490 [Gimesia aquarii]
MKGTDIATYLSIAIAIISTGLSIWFKIKTKWKVDELKRALKSIHDIARKGKWLSMLSVADLTLLIGQLESKLSDIEQYAKEFTDQPEQSEYGHLIEKGYLSYKSAIYKIEKSPVVKTIWLVTPDLEPDSSKKDTAEMVLRNLKDRKEYVYFYPDDLANEQATVERLYANIGISSSMTRLMDQITLIPISRQHIPEIFEERSNIIFFLKDTHIFDCYKEIVITRVVERGEIWDHLDRTTADNLYHKLLKVYDEHMSSRQ